MEFHPIANVFPLMEGEEFKELCEDIRDQGQQQPILTYEGMILDGRNRYRACLEAGEDPWIEQWSGNDPAKAVKSLNIYRRHLNLTSGQKAMLGIEAERVFAERAKIRQGKRSDLQDAPSTSVKNLTHVEEKSKPDIPQVFAECSGEAREQAAKLVGTNRQYISDAKKLSTVDPEAAESVRRGEVSLNKAMEPHRKPKTERPAEAKDPKPKEPTVGEILGDEVENIPDWNLNWDVPPEGKEYRAIIKWVVRLSDLDADKIASYCRDAYEADRDLEYIEKMETLTAEFRRAFEKRRKELRPGNLRVVGE